MPTGTLPWTYLNVLFVTYRICVARQDIPSMSEQVTRMQASRQSHMLADDMMLAEEAEAEFYKLRPANKTDRL